MIGFTDEQVLEIRNGLAAFDSKLDALVKFTSSVVENRGNATDDSKEAFFAAGYTEANLIDVVIVVGDKTISNYIYNLTHLEIDWPIAGGDLRKKTASLLRFERSTIDNCTSFYYTSVFCAAINYTVQKMLAAKARVYFK
jgi:hypothetical protein